MSGTIQVRWSSGQDVCQNRSPTLARSLLYGSSNGMVSPVKLGREPVTRAHSPAASAQSPAADRSSARASRSRKAAGSATSEGDADEDGLGGERDAERPADPVPNLPGQRQQRGGAGPARVDQGQPVPCR